MDPESHNLKDPKKYQEADPEVPQDKAVGPKAPLDQAADPKALQDQAVGPKAPQGQNVGLKAPQGQEGVERDIQRPTSRARGSVLRSRGEVVVGSITSGYQRGVTGLRIVSCFQVCRPQKEEKKEVSS